MDHCSQVLYHEYHTSATREYRNIEGNVVDVNVSDGAWSNGLWHLARFIDRYCNVIFCVVTSSVFLILNWYLKSARNAKVAFKINDTFRVILWYNLLSRRWNTNCLDRIKKAVMFKENTSAFSFILIRLTSNVKNGLERLTRCCSFLPFARNYYISERSRQV